MGTYKHIMLAVCIIVTATNVYCIDTYSFWIPFTDKNNNGYNLEKPNEFLSQKSVERRLKYGIPFTFSDLPVTQGYIQEIAKTGFTIQNVSKWFNGIVVYSYDSSLIQHVKQFDFVKEPILIGLFDDSKKNTRNKFDIENTPVDSFQSAFSQINLANGFYLHNKNLKGHGMTIAVIDAGFQNANKLSSLQHLWESNRIVSIKDFSTFPQNIFTQSSHGTHVLSIIAGVEQNKLEGSAPEASFHLLRSEVVNYEQPIEEYNWMAAAEYADSIGVDIINSSLGYSYFDEPFKDHSYYDLNSKTTVVSKAATMAASKGILVVNSAGNEGNKLWKYIIAPADADSILAVGATDYSGAIATFSSIGPTPDNRFKPDIVAMGLGVTYQSYDGFIKHGNGTSYAAPIITGLTACLWQAYPQFDANIIRKAVVRSSNMYNMPNAETGYGMPDYEDAFSLLEHLSNVSFEFNISPNPANDNLNLQFFTNQAQPVFIRIYNLQSQLIVQQQLNIDYFSLKTINIGNLRQGIYIVCIDTGKSTYTEKIFKLPAY